MSNDVVGVTPGAGKNVAGYGFTEDAITKIAQRIALNAQDGTDIMGVLTNPAWTTGDPASLVALWRAIRAAIDLGTDVANLSKADLDIIASQAQSTVPVNIYPLPTTPVSGLTISMTGTASVAVTGMSAGGSGKFNYITQLTAANSHATQGTNIEIQDGSGGTTFFVLPAASLWGGATLSFPTPLKQPTANTALFAKNTTTGAATILSASGFQL